MQQLRINQRISQAAIRRLNAVEARLNSGLQARDLCGYSVGPPQLGAGITSAAAGASLAPVAPADPAKIVDPGRSGPGDPLTLSATQLLINQRIDQAAIRRATGITNRLKAGLTGGDVRAAQVTQGKLFDRLQIPAKVLRPSRRPPTPPSRRAATRPIRAASPSAPTVEDQPAHRPGRGAQRQRADPAPGDRPVGGRPAPGHPDGRRPGLTRREAAVSRP